MYSRTAEFFDAIGRRADPSAKYWRYPLITTTNLREYTFKNLAQMAKQHGISGWHSMKKDELIRALQRRARTKQANSGARSRNGSASKSRVGSKSFSSPSRSTRRTKVTVSAKPSAVARKIQQSRIATERQKDLASANGNGNGKAAGVAVAKDRIVLMVRDPFWLQAHWEITSSSIERAKAAMAAHWHTAVPVLRLFEVATGNTTSSIESPLRDIPIHGGVNNWYIDVKDPPQGFRCDIGYLSSNGRFHCIAHSNTVITPQPGSGDGIDENWLDMARNCERIFALSGGYSQDHATMAGEIQELFEERLRRPLGSPMVTRYGLGAQSYLDHGDDFRFDVDAAMIVFGVARADSHVTVGGEPVKVSSDGTFSMRLGLPDRRQVVPIVASTCDGTRQQTIVLAVERNTKVMEPVSRDAGE
jgi:hypothetical protein